MIHPGINIVVSLLTATCAYYLAKNKNRGRLRWLVLGALFGLPALILLLVLPKCATARGLITPRTTDSTPTEDAPEPALQPTPVAPRSSAILWHYLDRDGQQQGPSSLQRLKRLKLEGVIGPQTYLWNPTLTEWTRLESCAELASTQPPSR